MLENIKKNYFLLISTFFILYFIFNLLGGERCLFSFFKKKILLIDLQNKKVELTDKIQDFESKNTLLTDNLDLDFVETLIRDKFLFGKKNETLYIIKNNDN
jgi:cell division protein DivIC